MNTYPIPPEDCLILKAIHHTESLREAAKYLSCDPAGLMRKVKRISEENGLLTKINGSWVLTPRGQSLLRWTEESIQGQIKALNAQTNLRIATTMWFSELVIIPHLKDLKAKTKASFDIEITIPDVGLEKALKEGQADVVMACHPPEDPIIAHKKIAKEQWVIIVPFNWSAKLKNKSNDEVRSHLLKQPFIRHNKINPEIVFPDAGNLYGDISLTVDHLIGVRSAVIHELGWSCVPKLLVNEALERKEVALIDMPVSIQNDVCLWWPRNRSDLKKISAQLTDWMGQIFK